MNRAIPFLFLVLFLSPSVEAKDGVPAYGAGGVVTGSLPKRAHRKINAYQRKLMERYLFGTQSSLIDSLRMVVVPVQFADSLMGGQPGSHRPEVRDSLFFANELKHLRDYYMGASRGRFHVVWDLVGTIVDLPHGMGYYGDDREEEMRVVEMVQSVIDSVDEWIDFSRYHTIFMIHAGAGQETDTFDDSRIQLWSSLYDREDIENAFPDSSVTGLATNDSLSGVPYFVDNFIIAPANAGQDVTNVGTLGIWAYEVGSRIGLVPLSDSTPAGFPDSRGAGNFCLMSWGLYTALGFIPAFPCAFNRVLAGWVDPLEIDKGGMYRLGDINSSSDTDTSCIKIPINGNEYFLVVNRVHDTNFDSLFTFVNLDSTCLTPDNGDSLGGAEFDFFLTDLTNPFVVKDDPQCAQGPRRYVITGSGIYIWHVNERVMVDNLAAGFLPNDFASRKGVDLEEADGIQDLDGTGGAISLGGFFDSFRLGHNERFGPDTDPSSASDLGADTGIIVQDVTAPGKYMQLRVLFSRPYEQRTARWVGTSLGQPPTLVDLNGDGEQEVIVFTDPGAIYAFRLDGREYFDSDGDPTTIQPYVFVGDSVIWGSAPAVGDVDGLAGDEMVALDVNGDLYAWHADGSELVDGDDNPATLGPLIAAGAICQPMLVDVDDDGAGEISIVSRMGDSLLVYFVDDSGKAVPPSDPAVIGDWPVRIGAQSAVAAYGACGGEYSPSEGIVLAFVDTVGMRFGLVYLPVRTLPAPLFRASRSHVPSLARPDGADLPFGGWEAFFPLPSGLQGERLLEPAVGDMDGDGVEEVTLVAPTGAVLFLDPSSPTVSAHWSEKLRGSRPSPPSLGDVDGNGTLEAALWDHEFFYLFNGNGTLASDWPVHIPPRGFAPAEPWPLPEDLDLPAPLLGDIDGDGAVELIFASPLGVLYGLDLHGELLPGFPRPSSSGVSRTPAVATSPSQTLFVVSAGSYSALEHYDAVLDTQVTEERSELFVQGLPGASGSVKMFWESYRNGPERWGRTFPSTTPLPKEGLVQRSTFILYPNPVTGDVLNVRIVVNRRADVGIIVFNLEGEKTLGRRYRAVNDSSLPDYVFDERLDVKELSSGLYFAKIRVEGDGESLSLIKPFAIRR